VGKPSPVFGIEGEAHLIFASLICSLGFSFFSFSGPFSSPCTLTIFALDLGLDHSGLHQNNIWGHWFLWSRHPGLVIRPHFGFALHLSEKTLIFLFFFFFFPWSRFLYNVLSLDLASFLLAGSGWHAQNGMGLGWNLLLPL